MKAFIAGSSEAIRDFRHKASRFLCSLFKHKDRFEVGDLVRALCFGTDGHPDGSYELAMILEVRDSCLGMLVGEKIRFRDYFEVLTLAEYDQLAKTAECISFLASDEEIPSCPKIKEELSAMFSTILKK